MPQHGQQLDYCPHWLDNLEGEDFSEEATADTAGPDGILYGTRKTASGIRAPAVYSTITFIRTTTANPSNHQPE